MSFRNGRNVTVSIADDADTIQTTKVAQAEQGLLIEAKIDIPDSTNGVTFTFSILDEDDDTRYSIALLPDNTATILLPNRMIRRGYKFGITPSGVTGNDIDVVIDPTYEV